MMELNKKNFIYFNLKAYKIFLVFKEIKNLIFLL